MEQYIKKSAVVAELERLITELVEEGEDTMFEQGRISAFEDVKVFINHTLEVKEVEVPVSRDLEEAANDYAHDIVHDDVFETFIAGALWQKQQLIDKACQFLKEYQEYPNHDISTNNLLEAFKMYMEIRL